MITKYTYTFKTYQEAYAFIKKYASIWFITDPVQIDEAWTIDRFVTHL
jgi:hypothetical protein